ncbi:MAG: RagB/SusD family nutrient uptake outer membrane protein, partial [Duncaniella sp.]|nr:RagB/SusD family nutrient uptake outer membrane protein [Duncaniella sp.]
MKFYPYIIGAALALSMGFTSCVGDLDVDPEDPNSTTALDNADQYYGLLARAYGGLVLEGGITVDDGGAGVYTRQLWNLQELPTDEAIV